MSANRPTQPGPPNSPSHERVRHIDDPLDPVNPPNGTDSRSPAEKAIDDYDSDADPKGPIE